MAVIDRERGSRWCLNTECNNISSYVGLYCGRCAYAMQQAKHKDADKQLNELKEKLAGLKKQVSKKKVKNAKM